MPPSITQGIRQAAHRRSETGQFGISLRTISPSNQRLPGLAAVRFDEHLPAMNGIVEHGNGFVDST